MVAVSAPPPSLTETDQPPTGTVICASSLPFKGPPPLSRIGEAMLLDGKRDSRGHVLQESGRGYPRSRDAPSCSASWRAGSPELPQPRVLDVRSHGSLPVQGGTGLRSTESGRDDRAATLAGLVRVPAR